MLNGLVKLGDTIYERFYTFDSVGAAVDADSTPTINIEEDGVSIAAAGATIADIGVGEYRATIVCSSGNGYSAGKRYQASISVVVGGATKKGSIGSWMVVARDSDDLAFPNTSGRGVDVSAGGGVAPDWANVKSPTTVVGLSGTTVKTATDVETDTQDIQNRLPAALVGGRMDASVGAYQSGQAPLQPTTAGRTLDVTVTGEAGIDLGNVGNPTAVQNFSGVTIKTATDVETDTQDIQNRLPASLSGGRMRAQVEGLDADTVNANAVAPDAVTEIQSGLATSSAQTALATAIDEIAGLLLKNAVIDERTYVGGNLTAARIRVFADATAAGAATTDAADDADGEIRRYQMTATYSGSDLTRYQLVREL
jgi:hypothetical protein